MTQTPTLTLPANSKMRDADFLFGVATSSFQIEGAAEHRLPNIWDDFCAQKGTIKDGSHGRDACQHVQHWQEDVELIKSLNVDSYRLSISWPRVMNKDGSLNDQGLSFYVALIDALNAANIKVFVTLYHWDLPSHLEEHGGWRNRATAYAFRDYADKVSQVLGERVYAYTTLNEPFCSAYLGHELGIHAPGLRCSTAAKQAAHHLLLAHGLAMTVLRRNCPNQHHGIVVNISPIEPLTNSDEDRTAAENAHQLLNSWYTDPLFHGRYPAICEQLPEAERPPVEDGDFDIIQQPLDYIGVNYYTRERARASDNQAFELVEEKVFPITAMGWEVYPQGLVNTLLRLHQDYPLPPLYITENGAAMDDEMHHGRVRDNERIDYFQRHLNAVHEAIEAGVDIRGYFAWSLMDNFEWAEGYLKRFGLVYVDYDSQQRVLKDSALAYQALLAGRCHTAE